QRSRELVEFEAALRLENRLTGVEEQFGLEHETIADDPNIGTIAQNRAEPAEEIGAVARQFLHPLGERKVEALAEVGKLALRLLVTLFGRIQRILQGTELTSQRRYLLVEDFDLRQRPGRDAFLAVELTGKLTDLVGSRRGAAAGALVQVAEAIALPFRRREA